MFIIVYDDMQLEMKREVGVKYCRGGSINVCLSRQS